MTEVAINKRDTIVNALLQVSDRVIEVSRDHVFTEIWNAEGTKAGKLDDYLGMRIRDMRNDSIFQQCEDRVENCFRTGGNDYLEYSLTIGNAAVTYSIRIVSIHPDPNYLFIVLKNLSTKEGERVEEDKWKLALDASGDGMWDANLETGKIFFSSKWHELFGYEASDFDTTAEWKTKIHPDDLHKTEKVIADHVEGRTPSYVTEVRYICKDGSYKWILSRGVVISRTKEGKPLRFIGTHTDITAQKIAEEEHQRSAKLLSELLNSLRDGIIVTNENSEVVFANQAFCDIYELSIKPSDIVGGNIEDGLKARKDLYKDPEGLSRKTMKIMNEGKAVFDEELELKNGKTFVRDYIPVSLDDNKQIAIWKLRDITEMKNTEKRITQLRVFYEQILNNIAAHVVVFDAQRRYMFLNPVAVKDPEMRKWMLGKTDEEYFAYRNRPMSIADRRRETFELVRQTKQTLTWEERMETPAGKIEYHLRTMAPVYNENGELDMMIGYGLDITDRVTAQEELKTSQETFASAFDYSGIGMALISPYGKWLDVNKVICDLTGYTKEEFLGLDYHDITYEADKDLDHELLNKLLQHEISTYTIEKRYLSKKKKIILVSLTLSLVWNSDDTPKFFIAQVLDITKKKELENEIQHKNTELEAARVSLVNKISQMEELSHIIAHNLRGPAGNISMIAEALVAKNKGGKAAEDNPLSSAFTVQEALGFIQDSSTALMNSLHTLMEIAEIKLNKEVPYNDCDVAAIINDITTQLHSTIFEKHATIKTDIQITSVKYPKAYLESILYNFISNALKYSIATVPPEINIITRLHNDRVQIIVKDNGIGIDMKKYGDRVFRLNEVFHKGYDSKGVGLYITKTQVESFGGTIEVHSAPNLGSEFIVTL